MRCVLDIGGGVGLVSALRLGHQSRCRIGVGVGLVGELRVVV